MGRTSIQVDETVADRLHDMKNRGETYNDVIVWLLEDGKGEVRRSEVDQ